MGIITTAVIIGVIIAWVTIGIGLYLAAAHNEKKEKKT